jgi:hypothetical protein
MRWLASLTAEGAKSAEFILVLFFFEIVDNPDYSVLQ